MSLPTLDNLAPKEAGGAATKFPGIVADLDTRPNAIGGLSAAELKAKFDEAARVIQNYINNVLLPAMLSSGATSIGYQASAADLPDYRPDTVSDALAGLESLVASLLPIKVNGKVCFCNNLTIPVSGSISAAYNSIYPRPLAGDYVVNQNGELGHITSVVIGDVVTVTAANYTLKAVLTDETQNLSATQKARARSNIGALGSADTEAKYVKYDDYASYTDAQKATARANIGALEKANPHVETRMTVDGVLDAEGGIEAYDDVTVEGALTVKDASQESGVSLSQTAADVLSFAGATPQTKPVLRNIAGPVMNNDAATKAYVDAADAAQAQQAAETYLPKENPAATGELTIEGELTLADALGNEVHVQAGSGNAMVLQGGSNHAGTVEIKGVGTPTADNSAAPKGYVDTQIAGVNKILLYDGTISATAGDTAALSTTSFSPQNAILGDVVVGTNGYTASVQTKLTPTMFVVRSTGQQFAPGGGGGGGGLSGEAKAALLNCFAHVAWIDEHGQDYYDALEAALYPPADLVSISAVFNQGQTVIYDTDSLDDLKPMLTVTAHYSDSTTTVVTNYTLSGTLSVGTSTITVFYGGKTTTFNVTVTESNTVYMLTNRIFNNDGSVDTGIAYLTTDKDFTIMCNADFAGQQAGQSWCLFKIMNPSSPYEGVCVTARNANVNYLMVVWMTENNVTEVQQTNIPLEFSYVGNVRVVLTHTAGSSAMTYYVKVGENAVVSATLSSPFASVTTNIAVGGNLSNSQKFNGTVNLFALYDVVKTNDEINTFLS